MTYKSYRARVARLQHKMEEAVPKRNESLLLRRTMIENAYAEQLRIERSQIASRMQHLVPGAKKVFLQSRLQKLERQLK